MKTDRHRARKLAQDLNRYQLSDSVFNLGASYLESENELREAQSKIHHLENQILQMRNTIEGYRSDKIVNAVPDEKEISAEGIVIARQKIQAMDPKSRNQMLRSIASYYRAINFEQLSRRTIVTFRSEIIVMEQHQSLDEDNRSLAKRMAHAMASGMDLGLDFSNL